MYEGACCFTGHRKLKKDKLSEVKEDLRKILEALIENGYTDFLAGGALGFDTVAASEVLDLKNKYPNIKLILVLPCCNQADGWRKKDVEVYENIKDRCDKVIYVSQNYESDCMRKRNYYLVDHSSTCVCYYTNPRSGTGMTVKYAKQKGLQIINLTKS
ncbi:MAG: DUF1273 family protein [Firmicutes bacterium]|nr:DUF1273 family protein [Bacillota bacterium]